MKKILFLAVFMAFSSFAFNAMATSGCPQTNHSPDHNCLGCKTQAEQVTCCGNEPASSTNLAGDGCMVGIAPINKGLIFLLIAGMGLGAFVVYKSKGLKLV